MATVIQLFNDEDTTLSAGYLDVSDNIPVPITYSVADVKVIGNRTASSTKSVILPGTKNNNQLFGQLFDVNIEFGLATYNIYKKQKCAIITDNRIVLDNAYIQLVSVSKKNNIQTSEDEILYEVIIKSQIFDFFTQIQNKYLEDLDFSRFNHEFSAAQINSAMSHTWVDGYKYIIPFIGTGSTYNINELKPSIYAKQYWDDIHKESGYSYEWDSLDNEFVVFNKMIITANDTSNRISDYINEGYSVKANNTVMVNEFVTSGNNVNATFDKKIRFNNEFDPANKFDLSNDWWVNPFTYPEKINIRFQLNYTEYLDNSAITDAISGGNSFMKTYLVIRDVVAMSDLSVTQIAEYTWGNGDLIVPASDAVELRNSGQPIQVDVELTNLPLNTTLDFFIRYDIDVITLGAISIEYRNEILPRSTIIEEDATPQLLIEYASENVPFGFDYPMNTIIPKKIKQRDFIDSVIKMFNLYVEPSKENDRNLVYKRRDDFYDEGKILNWSNKLMQNMDQKVEFLSDLNFKTLTLTYKSDSDAANKVYTDATKEVYGQININFDTEWLKNNEKVELAFSPTPIGVSSWFGITPYLNYRENFNMRILIDNGPIDSRFTVFNYFITTPVIDFDFVVFTSYCPFTHLYNLFAPTYDINFGQIQYTFTNSSQIFINSPVFGPSFYYWKYQSTDNNLYNLNYKRTYQQLNSSRLLTAYFDLNEVDIATLSLADKVWCMNKYWLINTIVDYDANANKPTQVELISYEDESIVFFPD